MTNRDLDRIRFIARHFNDLQGLRVGVPLGLLTLAGATCFSGGWLLPVRLSLLLGGLLLAFGAKRYYRRTFGEVEPLPAVETASLALSGPAGPAQRLAGFEVPPAVQRILAALGVALALFFILQAVTPAFAVRDDARVTLDSVLEAQPAWSRGFSELTAHSPASPSTERAVFAQLAYALYGTFLLALWQWRERHPSQGYLLTLGVPLLGLSVLGTCLGYFVYADGLTYGIVSLLVPALVQPSVALILCGIAAVSAGLLDHRQLAGASAGHGGTHTSPRADSSSFR